MAAVTAGCGSRLSTEQIRADSVVKGARTTTNGAAASAEGDSGAAAGADASGAAPTGDAGAATAAASTGGASTGAKAATAAPTKKAPIIIGYIGWLSGTGGETMAPTRDVWVAWARTVNAHGGINGHPVQLLVGDHGGNESQAVAIARDFVENKGAIALTEAAGGPAVGDWAKSKGIPVIGSILTGGDWNANPMLFPPFGSDQASSWGSARLMKKEGTKKLSIIYCAESNDCASGSERVKQAAEAEGIQVVSSTRYSVTAPDYTAECIQMRSAGADTVYPTGDTGSMIRMARACARQNFHPTWVSPTMDDSVASNPDFEGAVDASNTFPWFLRSGHPLVQEYATALQTYAPSRLTRGNTFMPWSWVSAKIFEKAAQHVSDKPTTQDILEGLWAMKGETLGGLLQGPAARTFTRGQPTPETFCTYEGRLHAGKWEAPQGISPICR